MGGRTWWREPSPDALGALAATDARAALAQMGAQCWTLWASAAFDQLLGTAAQLPGVVESGGELVAAMDPRDWLDTVPVVLHLRELAGVPSGTWPAPPAPESDADLRWAAAVATLRQVDLVVALTATLHEEGFEAAADLVATACRAIVDVLVPDLCDGADDEPDGAPRGYLWYLPEQRGVET